MGREPLPLTPTQQLLFERLSRGYPTSKMLARDLRMNPKRIDKHFEDACRRLAVDNRRQALVIWLKNRDSTPGDHPPGEPIPLHNSISGDNLKAPFDKEGAQNVEMETMEVRDADRASYESPDGGQDHTVSELARSGGPPSPSLRKIAAAGTNPSMGGDDREPGALVAGSNDTRGHIAWNGGNREGPPALLSGLGLGDEHQLTWRAQVGFAVGLVVLIAGCSLIALFAVKELLLQLE